MNFPCPPYLIVYRYRMSAGNGIMHSSGHSGLRAEGLKLLSPRPQKHSTISERKFMIRHKCRDTGCAPVLSCPPKTHYDLISDSAFSAQDHPMRMVRVVICQERPGQERLGPEAVLTRRKADPKHIGSYHLIERSDGQSIRDWVLIHQQRWCDAVRHDGNSRTNMEIIQDWYDHLTN